MNNIITLAGHSFIDKLDKNSLVLDCGGYIGEFTDKIFEKYNCFIHIFEADEKLYADLEKKYEQNPNIYPANVLISEFHKSYNFYYRRNGQTSGSIFLSHPSVGIDSKIMFGISLSHICEMYARNKPIDLLKLDIEGAEIGVIMNSFECFKLCKQITVEFHEFCNIGIKESDVTACISKLELLGFTFKNCSLQDKPKYFDCLFYREGK